MSAGELPPALEAIILDELPGYWGPDSAAADLGRRIARRAYDLATPPPAAEPAGVGGELPAEDSAPRLHLAANGRFGQQVTACGRRTHLMDARLTDDAGALRADPAACKVCLRTAPAAPVEAPAQDAGLAAARASLCRTLAARPAPVTWQEHLHLDLLVSILSEGDGDADVAFAKGARSGIVRAIRSLQADAARALAASDEATALRAELHQARLREESERTRRMTAEQQAATARADGAREAMERLLAAARGTP